MNVCTGVLAAVIWSRHGSLKKLVFVCMSEAIGSRGIHIEGEYKFEGILLVHITKRNSLRIE